MNREQLRARLDTDRNGKVNFEDVVAAVEGNTKKLMGVGIGIGLVIGLVVGAIFL